MPEHRLGVLISGRGSNMRSLVRATSDGRIRAELALVLSDVGEAPGLAWAGSQGLPVASVARRDYPTRAAHEAAVLDVLGRHGVNLVCLAGFMRLLGPGFVAAFPMRLLNIHPSLLPAFPGLEAQRQAWEHGVKVAGATVHFVDEQLDHGPILLQETVPVLDDDSLDSLSARILEVEHQLYPRAIGLICDGRVSIEGRRVHIRPPT